MTRYQLRLNVRANLSDAGVTFFQDADINNSLQDAYNDVCAKCRCIVNSVTISWLSQVNYWDFLTGNLNTFTPVVDYLGTIAIFNNSTNLWLRDDLTLRDFDRLRIDWELWSGNAQYWAPKSLKYTVTVPKLTSATGTFILKYWGKAPEFLDTADTTQEPLIAPDMHDLLENFATADLLESAEEPIKASAWWTKYFLDRESYKKRCANNVQADLLQGI